jgi:hypothetical protein
MDLLLQRDSKAETAACNLFQTPERPYKGPAVRMVENKIASKSPLSVENVSRIESGPSIASYPANQAEFTRL